ncbi:MAG TPA: hypothetical protein VLA04_01775 [Verrucomicrobiae bacterium]|nr:hypothetical protein [Verrucomicrobiae bacterium]
MSQRFEGESPLAKLLPLALLVLLAALALAGYLAYEKNKDSADASPDGVTVTASPSPTLESVTDLSGLLQSTDVLAFRGQKAEFQNAPVKRVTGDRTFSVGTLDAEQLYVLLTPSLDEGTTEQQVAINAGQTVNLTGVIKEMPSVEEIQRQWLLSAEEAAAAKDFGVYLDASKAEVTSQVGQ